jgi:hypothetical protein
LLTGANLPVIDDFETGLAAGKDANNNAIGFYTFQDGNAGTTVAISTTAAPPAPVPGAGVPNTVLKLDVNVVAYAGFVHAFENAAVNTWVSQDWSAYEGISFWLYGRQRDDAVRRRAAPQPRLDEGRCGAGRFPDLQRRSVKILRGPSQEMATTP